MKRIYYIFLAVLGLAAFQSNLSAQKDVTIDKTTGNPSRYTLNKKGIGYSKAITGPNSDGIYTIHLHTFVAGNGELTHNDLPADVVLVLDVSGSMDDVLESTVTYNELASTSYSYNSVEDNTNLWYLYEGQYYQVYHEATFVDSDSFYGLYYRSRTYTYHLCFNDASGKHYLSGNGDSRNEPSNSPTNTVRRSSIFDSFADPNSSETIYTGVLYTKTEETVTKMDALKKATNAFIDLILENDTARDGSSLGNTISIVKFAGDRFCNSKGEVVNYATGASDATKTGNHTYNDDGYTYNYTEIVEYFTEVKDGGAQTLKNAVKGLQPGGATASDYGMAKAEALIGTLYNPQTNKPNRQSNKTVVFFTDGEPNHHRDFVTSVADDAIASSKDIKAKVAYTDKGKDINVSVYSVGVFDKYTDQIEKYMNLISSNYPNAENMSTTTSTTDPTWNGNYYQNASSGNLEDIFRSIASESGGNQSLNSSTITAIDVVSQSFDIPDNAGEITIYEVPVKSADKNDPYSIVFYSKAEVPGWIANPAGVRVIPDENNPNKITVTGFNYAQKYCGVITEDGVDKPHGSKLVIEIPIEMAENAVGGPGVETNGPGSGIFLEGSTTPELEFESPTVDLPVNLQIKKVDLQVGESAKFKIQRTPKANTPSASSDWEDVTTIFITRTADNAEPDVYVRGLDPNYHYRILEEDWGWSYKFNNATGEGYIDDNKNVGKVTIENKEEVTSDKFVSNPITFKNTKKTRIETKVRHAESKATNTFNATQHVSVDSKTTKWQNNGTVK